MAAEGFKCYSPIALDWQNGQASEKGYKWLDHSGTDARLRTVHSASFCTIAQFGDAGTIPRTQASNSLPYEGNFLSKSTPKKTLLPFSFPSDSDPPLLGCGERAQLPATNWLFCSQVSVPDLSSATTLKVEPGYGPAAPKPAPVSGPASRPPWAVDPSFAERYAPDKTSTVLSKHSQPATPTPMQNRNSIVQAAQQGPEGASKTPICCQCNKIIRGRYLVALGRYYHPEEFTCSQCRKVLDEGGFFEEKGSIFCPKCYDMRYAPNCAKCKKKITGADGNWSPEDSVEPQIPLPSVTEIMHALKMTWHVQCFICAACKTPIRNRAFYMEEGQPYCERGMSPPPLSTKAAFPGKPWRAG
ncbi:PDZ and LIM domain protein 7 [Varanus komodoensis]|nr:PDZ and LIM domain protein 7 [Varanus komodoensis]